MCLFSLSVFESFLFQGCENKRVAYVLFLQLSKTCQLVSNVYQAFIVMYRGSVSQQVPVTPAGIVHWAPVLPNHPVLRVDSVLQVPTARREAQHLQAVIQGAIVQQMG